MCVAPAAPSPLPSAVEAALVNNWMNVYFVLVCVWQDAGSRGPALNFHSPPTSSLLSKQVGTMPSSRQALMVDRPEGPAPMTATLYTMVTRLVEDNKWKSGTYLWRMFTSSDIRCQNLVFCFCIRIWNIGQVLAATYSGSSWDRCSEINYENLVN